MPFLRVLATRFDSSRHRSATALHLIKRTASCSTRGSLGAGCVPASLLLLQLCDDGNLRHEETFAGDADDASLCILVRVFINFWHPPLVPAAPALRLLPRSPLFKRGGSRPAFCALATDAVSSTLFALPAPAATSSSQYPHTSGGTVPAAAEHCRA
ncbi:hypothetical protein C8R45DRAFT_189420 [Mycena sanguinolenta]|nr:hypothetical protein C8R45DRAFT_189420 [Mycena sanguinolenta]